MSFFENTRKPTGFGGKLMVSLMNVGRRALSGWGLRFLNLAPDAKVLDCGCGGGAACSVRPQKAAFLRKLSANSKHFLGRQSAAQIYNFLPGGAERATNNCVCFCTKPTP